MFRRRTLHQCLVELGLRVLDSDDLKAIMISKNDDGDVQITLVEGKEQSHKVRFGRINSSTRELVRDELKATASRAA